VSPYRPCARCGAPVKFRDRDLCHACHRRAARETLKSPCPGCGRPRPAKTVTCRQCGEQRRNAGHGLCNRCKLADPDWPFRCGTSLAARMGDVPGWWQALTEFAAARHHPGGAVAILRCAARILLDDPSASPRKITDGAVRPDGTPTAEGRALAAFFTDRGLAMPGDQGGRRAAARRQRYLDGLPAGLAAAVAAFNDAQLAERERDRRAGRRLLSDVTLETRLRILRDLARHLACSGRISGWAEVTTADLEGFLAGRARNRHQETYVLRRYLAWARQRRLILIDPARPLRPGPQPGFTGTVLGTGAQRTLLSRWTSDSTHPHERLAGLLALLHAASSAEIRSLAVTGVNDRKRTVMLPGRPFPVPADPATWDAVQACLDHRDQLATLNPHLIVTKATRTGNAPADGSYLTRRLAPAGVTPSACRQTRIAQFVNDLDPKLTAAALGMQDSGLVRYLADNVDNDRLQRLSPR
jgi:hypothetical protein